MARIDASRRFRTERICRHDVACRVGLVFLWAALWATAAAAIPATPLMTVYQFNGPRAIPYYDADTFRRRGAMSPVGAIAHGSAVLPCLVIRGGKPLTNRSGTPFVGFEVIVDADRAAIADVERYREISKLRAHATVADHHCAESIRNVIDSRRLFARDKPPWFDPARPVTARVGEMPGEIAGDPAGAPPGGELDAIVHAFHESDHCATANRPLLGRRQALERGWNAFVSDNPTQHPATALERARDLDYVMRTALYEGHLGRGCNAYGSCERNVIALSIRNRALERCARGQGCRFNGDFHGVAATVTQYNIWDELLTQTTGLTSCFLRADLAGQQRYAKLQAMYAQSRPDLERVLFGGEAGLQAVFPNNPLTDLKRLRHYYHPPAMGVCFPGQPRLEYVSGATARAGKRFAMIVNQRVDVGEARDNGYLFQLAAVDKSSRGDVVELTDAYPGFVIDGRKIQLRKPRRCTPYGTSSRCRHGDARRHRKTPSWLSAGSPLQLECVGETRGEDCAAPVRIESAQVGGRCDTEMQPIAGVP